MSGTATWLDACAKPATTVTGVTLPNGRTISILHVYGGAKDAASASVVEPMVEELLETPAMVLGLGPYDIVAATWARKSIDLYVNVWIERNPIEDAYAAAVALIDPVESAYRAHAHAYDAESSLQSLVLKHFDGIQAREWPVGSNRWFLVLPWTAEVKVNQAATYAAA